MNTPATTTVAADVCAEREKARQSGHRGSVSAAPQMGETILKKYQRLIRLVTSPPGILCASWCAMSCSPGTRVQRKVHRRDIVEKNGEGDGGTEDLHL